MPHRVSSRKGWRERWVGRVWAGRDWEARFWCAPFPGSGKGGRKGASDAHFRRAGARVLDLLLDGVELMLAQLDFELLERLVVALLLRAAPPFPISLSGWHKFSAWQLAGAASAEEAAALRIDAL